MTRDDFEAVIRSLPDALAWASAHEDPKVRAVFLNRLADAVDQVNKSVGVPRQDAVREIKNAAEARGELWQHRDTARLLGITVEKAGRIANAKLKRDEPGE